MSQLSKLPAVVCFLLGDSPASDLYMPTFRNTICSIFTTAFEDGTDRVFRNVGIYKSDAGESPKRKQTTILLISKISSTCFGANFCSSSGAHDSVALSFVKCGECLDSRSLRFYKAFSYFCVAVFSNTTTSVRFFSYSLQNIVVMTWELCDDLWNLCDDLWNLCASVVWMLDLTWRVACG